MWRGMDKLKRFLKILGPGYITGAADDDPTAIVTYTQSGAQFGYGQLWTTLWGLPLMAGVQEMAGRIGMVTGRGIAFILKEHYPRGILWFIAVLLTVTNMLTIGADLGALSASARLLVPLPFALWLGVFSAGLILLQVLVPYPQYARILKFAALALLSYVGASFFIRQNWGEIFRHTLIPALSLKKAFLLNLAAIFGTNISPYLFFWQSNEEVEEEVEKGKIPDIDTIRPRVTKKGIHGMEADTVAGMVFSNIIVFFVEIAAAAALFHGGAVDTPAQAAASLRPFAGNFAYFLFLLGIFGSGILAVPVLAGSTAYLLAETRGWKAGLNAPWKRAPKFYAAIAVATAAGACVNFLPVKPFDLLVYASALNGAVTPVILVFVLLVANNKKIMGKRTNSLLSNLLGTATVLFMGASAVLLAFSFI